MARPAASIRSRLAGWFTAALALMLVLYAGASFLLVRHALTSQIDELLEDDWFTAHEAVRVSDEGQVSWRPEADTDSDESKDRGEEVWLPTGQIVHRSPAMVSLPDARRAPGLDVVDAKGHHWRTRTASMPSGAGTAIVRVARSTDSLHDELFELGTVLVGGIPIMVLIAAVAGSALAGRLLQPIEQLAGHAERITADRLHERLHTPNPNDEIGRLATVINGAFERIGLAFEQLRRFTADASHELRTPLAIVRGIGEATLAQPRKPAEYQDALGSILEENDRMTQLVNALLRLTNADANAVVVREAEINLLELAREVAASLGILVEDKQQRFAVSGEPVQVRADPLLVREALMNVVHNAVKYSPAGSTIRIEVRREGQHGVVAVDDQGPGVAPGDRDRVFDRFFRVDEARARDSGGSGLGLAIAKWAVEVNHGRIVVDAAPGGGASFRIMVPLVGERASSGAS
jgi:heavy metal sensor kinase